MAKTKKAKKKARKMKPKKKVVKRRKSIKKAKPKKRVSKVKKKLKRKRKSRTPRRKSRVSGKVSRRPKPVKKKRVIKPRPKKGRESSTTRKKRVSGKKPAKRRVKKTKPKRKAKPKKKVSAKKKVVRKKRAIKKKPVRKVKIKKMVRKLRRKPKSRGLSAKASAKAGARRRKSVGGKASRRPKKIIKRTRRKAKVSRRAKKRRPTKPRVYIGKGRLDQLFESQAKVKLLKFFFRNAEEMFQPKEIFKRLRSNMTLLRQEMKKLEKLGLLRQRKAWLSFEKKRGGVKRERKTVWYLNPNFDFFNELRELVLKSTVASKDELVEKARKIGNIKLLVLTGVFTGDEGAKADLLIVGDKINQRKLNNFIKDLEAEVGKEINCAVMSSKEFDYRYDMYDRFVRDILDGSCEILLKKIELW